MVPEDEKRQSFVAKMQYYTERPDYTPKVDINLRVSNGTLILEKTSV